MLKPEHRISIEDIRQQMLARLRDQLVEETGEPVPAGMVARIRKLLKVPDGQNNNVVEL